MIVIGKHADIGPAVIEIPSPFEVQALVVARDVVVVVKTDTDVETLEVSLQNRVHDAGYRVSAVNRRRAIAQHFDTLDAVHRHRIRVDRVYGHKRATDFLGLVTGRIDHAATVEQHERVAGAHVAQVERADVAAHRVDAARVHLGVVEVVLAHFRHLVEQLVARTDAHRLDFRGDDHGYGECLGDLGALDLGTGYRDFLNLLVFIVLVL